MSNGDEDAIDGQLMNDAGLDLFETHMGDTERIGCAADFFQCRIPDHLNIG